MSLLNPTFVSLKHLLAALVLLGGSTGLFAVTHSESGVLRFYAQPTQNGTVACRSFGAPRRPSKEIYYRTTLSPKSPAKDEADLIPYEMRLYTYDTEGNAHWIGIYQPEGTLQSSIESVYSKTGELQILRYRKADGTVAREDRREKGKIASSLHYGERGQHVIAINGRTPADINLYPGWGAPVEGLTLGVGVNRSRGKLEEIELNLSVRNASETSLNIARTLPRQEIQVELRDASGRVVPQDIAGLQDRDKRLQAINSGGVDTLQPIPPGESLVCSGPMPLNEWYGPLPSGRYILTVKRRAAGKAFVLVSKPIPLDIETPSIP